MATLTIGECIACICNRLSSIETKLDESIIDTSAIEAKLDILFAAEHVTQGKVDDVLESLVCECQNCDNYKPASQAVDET